MASLLDNGERRFIRMSETDDCRLKIAHKMIGTPTRGRRFNDMGMRMGRALEPMIVQYMAEQGLTMFYVLDEELEIVGDDPWRIGHNDGLGALLQEPSWWLQQQLPPEALEALMSGELLMIEMKTMNEGGFESFQRGGIAAGAFTKLYLGQIASYMGSWQDSSKDELWPDHDETLPDGTVKHVWGSTSFKALLKEHGWERPTKCLVIVFSPAMKAWGFELIHYDEARFNQRKAELSEMIDTLDSGSMPAPDHDGSNAECYMCSYAYLCPAVEKVRAERSNSIDNIPIMMTESGAQLDELAARYVALREDAKSNKAAMDEIKRDVRAVVGNGRAPLVTPGHIVKISDTKGRRSVDWEALKAMLPEGAEIPYMIGRPGTRLNIDALYGPQGKDEEAGNGE